MKNEGFLIIDNFSQIFHVFVLTLNVPCISESCIEMNIKLNFYFHTSLW